MHNLLNGNSLQSLVNLVHLTNSEVSRPILPSSVIFVNSYMIEMPKQEQEHSVQDLVYHEPQC